MKNFVKIFFQLPLSLQHIINSKTGGLSQPAKSHPVIEPNDPPEGR